MYCCLFSRCGFMPQVHISFLLHLESNFVIVYVFEVNNGLLGICLACLQQVLLSIWSIKNCAIYNNINA